MTILLGNEDSIKKTCYRDKLNAVWLFCLWVNRYCKCIISMKICLTHIHSYNSTSSYQCILFKLLSWNSELNFTSRTKSCGIIQHCTLAEVVIIELSSMNNKIEGKWITRKTKLFHHNAKKFADVVSNLRKEKSKNILLRLCHVLKSATRQEDMKLSGWLHK